MRHRNKQNNMSLFLKIEEERSLRRSKSLCSLDDVVCTDKVIRASAEGRARTISDSSLEVFVVDESDSESEGRGGCAGRGEGAADDELLDALERKVDRLSDLFQEQCRLLSSIQREVQQSRASVEHSSCEQSQALADLINNVIKQRVQELGTENKEPQTNSRAQSLLDAIEVRRHCSLDRDIREALTSFLQSDELKERVVSGTAAALRPVVQAGLARDVRALYLPALGRAHRRLARRAASALEDAFIELEQQWSQMSRQMQRASRSLRRALEAHRPPPRDVTPRDVTHGPGDTFRRTVERLLDEELKQWRERALETVMSGLRAEDEPGPAQDHPPLSPPQPHPPGRSVIDQLMMTAEISKQIVDGDVNGSFSRALSAADLSLVTAACRAAEQARVCAPRALDQPVLLALVQQLATDMLHDTQLKCRYLEDAIINLNTSHPATRAHLPLVVRDLREHLTRFLLAYPKHVAGRRVALIIMAADNLLKYC